MNPYKLPMNRVGEKHVSKLDVAKPVGSVIALMSVREGHRLWCGCVPRVVVYHVARFSRIGRNHKRFILCFRPNIG